MGKRYMVVMRRKGQKSWSVSDCGLQNLATAIKEAKTTARLYPRFRVQVWVEITTTKRLRIIQ